MWSPVSPYCLAKHYSDSLLKHLSPVKLPLSGCVYIWMRFMCGMRSAFKTWAFYKLASDFITTGPVWSHFRLFLGCTTQWEVGDLDPLIFCYTYSQSTWDMGWTYQASKAVWLPRTLYKILPLCWVWACHKSPLNLRPAEPWVLLTLQLRTLFYSVTLP